MGIFIKVFIESLNPDSEKEGLTCYRFIHIIENLNFLVNCPVNYLCLPDDFHLIKGRQLFPEVNNITCCQVQSC